MQQSPEKSKVISRLNPNIASVTIGIRSIRNIKIYPLSIADQLEFTDLITNTLQQFFQGREVFENNEQADIEFVAFIVQIIKDNLGRILAMISDEPEAEKLLKEITNMQGIEIAELIYDMNYGESLKKAESLIGKVKTLLPSMRQSAPSLSDIQGTTLDTSSEEDLETAD